MEEESTKKINQEGVKSKLPLWKEHTSWERAEAAWDLGAAMAEKIHPIKKLKQLPQIPGITPDASKRLKWKSFRYMLFHPEGKMIVRHFLKHPLRYGRTYLSSLFNKKSYLRDEDFFLYGVKSTQEFEKLLKDENALLVLGFSYCQKPFECPSGRFTSECIRDPDHPVCRQCDIGKTLHAAGNEQIIPLLIPTIHYIGDHLFKIVHTHPKKNILFMITACELTLEMFGDFGNMVGARGIGIRLDGRICNTMRAFELSETGIKPGLTVVTSPTQRRILDLLKSRSNQIRY